MIVASNAPVNGVSWDRCGSRATTNAARSPFTVLLTSTARDKLLSFAERRQRYKQASRHLDDLRCRLESIVEIFGIKAQ